MDHQAKPTGSVSCEAAADECSASASFLCDPSRHNRSMEQEVRDLIEGYVVERRAVLDQIEAGWNQQTRRPTAIEIDAWMGVGRP